MLIVHPDMGYGGAERQIVNLIKGLVKVGRYRIFLGLYECSGPLLKEISNISGVKLIDLEKHKIGYLTLIRRLRNVIRLNEVNVVYSLLIGPNVLVGLTRVTTNVERVVWGNRVSEFKPLQFGLKGWLAEIVSRSLSHRIDAIISNSLAGMEALRRRKILIKESVVIPNGIDLSRYFQSPRSRSVFRKTLGLSDSTIIIAQIGRIVDWKGHEIFLRAAEQTISQHDNVKFAIVGDGDYLWVEHLKGLRVTSRLGERLLWFAARDDIEVVLNGIDILTVASISGEGFPNIIGEAMAVGTPIVATNIGATVEILGKGGLIVQPKDIGGLAKAWSALIVDPAYRKQLGNFAVEQVQKYYSIDCMVQRTDQVLLPAGKRWKSKKHTKGHDCFA